MTVQSPFPARVCRSAGVRHRRAMPPSAAAGGLGATWLHHDIGEERSMRRKSNKAVRLRAPIARQALTPVPALNAATPFIRRSGFRFGAANSVAAAVAGILYGA